jgi:anaerobic selenocysteine-containing dehydrogenase
VVCIDPLRTITADRCDWHVQLLPGTDAALALGMMHVLVRDGLIDPDYIERATVGFDRLVARVAEWTPERSASICGLTVDDIERLATMYGRSRVPAIRVLIGMEHRQHGAMAYRTIACLPALVGAWQHRGGGMIRSTAPLFAQLLPIDVLERPDLATSPRRGVPMGDLGRVLTDPDPETGIHALVVYNCNPAVVVPDQHRILAGLARNDLFTVVLEQFMTDTARFADVVLPATTQIEHLDLMPAWGHLYLTLNLPAISPRGRSLSNSEIFRRIGAALGLSHPALADSDETMLRELLCAATHPFMTDITYDRLVDEHSIKITAPPGWNPYQLDRATRTEPPIRLAADHLTDDGLDSLPTWQPADESLHGNATLRQRYPLSCITTKRHQRFLNSSYAELDAHTTAEREPLLEIHHDDAAARNIADGDEVVVWNDRGSLVLRATVSDRVRSSVVTIPFGWPLRASGGFGANALTNPATTDLGGGVAFHDNLVEVTKRDIARAREATDGLYDSE